MVNHFSNDYCEKKRQEKGFAFGPQFDIIKEAWSSNNEALALIRPTEEITKEASSYVIHPSIIDACFQTMILVKAFEGKFVPRKITRVTMVQKPISMKQFYAHTQILGSEKTPTYNITLMDCHARPIMIIEKYATAEISSDMSNVTYENSSFTLGWEVIKPETSESANHDFIWLILSDQSMFAKRFIQHIPASERMLLFDETSDKFCKVLEEVESKMKRDEKLLVINFWPVDCSKYEGDTDSVGATHELAFESCLVISQEILKREILSKRAHLVFVTSGVVIIPEHDPVVANPDTFPWSASLFGFRRTFAEEIKAPSASLVDLPSNPGDEDFQILVEDLRKPAMEEEIVYRNGVRYGNRIKELCPSEARYTKPTSPFNKCGEQIPFKMTRMSGQWFLQKRLNDEINKRSKIEVYYACPVLQKRWEDLTTNDRMAFAGKLLNQKEENRVSSVVGVCKVDDLGSYIEVEKCSFSAINSQFSPQQAASLSFPLAISYHILANLLGVIQGQKVLIYNENEEVCCIFACVALSLDIKVMCVVQNASNKDQMKKFENLVVVSEDEIKAAQLNHMRCMDLDAACFFSKSSTFVTQQIMKHLKPGARVIIGNQEKNAKFDTFISGKNVQCTVIANMEDMLEYSCDFSKLLVSCYSALQSKNLLERLLEIPQLVSSIYDMMNDASKNTANESSWKTGFHTVSLKPTNIPEKVDFYSLPLDTNGLKADCTYLVIGGVRGFGFEFAKWMVENGAKTVLCTSRSTASAEKKALVRQLEENNGSRILLRQADATSYEDMNQIKKELESLPAVAGIAFTAMILEDQMLTLADQETCKMVMETKVKGKFLMPRSPPLVRMLCALLISITVLSNINLSSCFCVKCSRVFSGN
jgi:hypothetical protein